MAESQLECFRNEAIFDQIWPILIFEKKRRADKQFDKFSNFVPDGFAINEPNDVSGDRSNALPNDD